MNKAELEDKIIELILTGGRRTTAANVRELLNDYLSSYPNNDDGGFVVNNLLGLSTYIAPEDERHFTAKKYVDDLFSSIVVDVVWGDIGGDINDQADLITLLAGYINQGTNSLLQPLILQGDKIGFGGTPSGLVHFVLPNDTSPLSKTSWTGVDAVFGAEGDTAKALGVSYTTGTSTINMNFLEPGVQWLNAQFNFGKIGFYSGGGALGFHQNQFGQIGINTDAEASGSLLTIRGTDDSEDDYQLRTFNTSGDPVFSLRNDKGIFVHENPVYWKGNGVVFAAGDVREGYGLDPDSSEPAIILEKHNGVTWEFSSSRIL